MIVEIEFNELNKLNMYQLTKNTIILFNNSDLKYKVQKEFLKIKDSQTKDVDFSTEKDNDVEIKTLVEYLPTSIYNVDNEQHFTLTTEAPFILHAKDPYDIWFCDINKNNNIDIYPLTDFKDYKYFWDLGIYEVYKAVIVGRFGCYKGYGE